jgi:hypothetical protein
VIGRLALLGPKTLQIRSDLTDFFGLKDELRHVTVSGRRARGKCFNQFVWWIAKDEITEGRGFGIGAVARFSDGMAFGTFLLNDHQTRRKISGLRNTNEEPYQTTGEKRFHCSFVTTVRRADLTHINPF